MRAFLTIESLRVQGFGEPIVFFSILRGSLGPRARTITHVSLVQWSERRALYVGIFCMQSAPINVLKKSNFTCTVPPIQLPGPDFESQICACDSVLGDYSKKHVRAFFIYKSWGLWLLCLSHAFIQLQSVCAALEVHNPHSRLSTAVYVCTFSKSLFRGPSADQVFGSPRPSADASEGPYAVEVILNLEVPAAAPKWKKHLFLFFTR